MSSQPVRLGLGLKIWSPSMRQQFLLSYELLQKIWDGKKRKGGNKAVRSCRWVKECLWRILRAVSRISVSVSIEYRASSYRTVCTCSSQLLYQQIHVLYLTAHAFVCMSKWLHLPGNAVTPHCQHRSCTKVPSCTQQKGEGFRDEK